MRKRTTILIGVVLFAVSTGGWSQDVNIQPDSLLEVVAQKNPVLVAARRQMEASLLMAGTGITPENPEVEFGYMAGNPFSIGNRFDFSVSQHLEFPTAYFRMAEAKEIRQDQARLLYNVSRQEVLTRARKLVIERIHLNRLEQLLNRRMEQAGKLKEQYRSMLESGEVGKLSLSQVNLRLSVLTADLEQVRSDIRVNSEQIREITGGEEFNIRSMDYPLYAFPGMDSLEKAYAVSPKARLYSSQTDLKQKQKQVMVSKALPDFTAGYYSETVIDEGFRGVSLGISIPLWADKNKIKHARAEISVAQAENARFLSEQAMELRRNLERRNSLLKRIDALEQVLSEVDDEILLGLALELGEISLSEYIYSTEFYLQNIRRLMDYERDLKLVEAEIMKVYL